MNIFHSSCLLNIIAVCYGACIQHNAWSVEATTFSSDVRHCLMDHPNCPCSLLPRLFGLLRNFVEPSPQTRVTL